MSELVDAEDDWLEAGLEDDLRPRFRQVREAGEAFALVTLVKADGGPRPVGSQMVITRRESWGFLSGGCVEADVRLHARDTLADGEPRELVYGRGSPFADIRLPCGGSLRLKLERLAPDDPTLVRIEDAANARETLVYASDGRRRQAGPPETLVDATWPIMRTYHPPQRLVVVGSDPFALAMAGLGHQIGWDVTLVRPKGPATPPPLPIRYSTRDVISALGDIAPDRWTAIAVASHDIELDCEALAAALTGPAGYVGVLGSRRRLDDRLAGLARRGICADVLGRLKAPIGLDIGATSPWEIAVAVIGEIIASRAPHG